MRKLLFLMLCSVILLLPHIYASEGPKIVVPGLFNINHHLEKDSGIEWKLDKKGASEKLKPDKPPKDKGDKYENDSWVYEAQDVSTLNYKSNELRMNITPYYDFGGVLYNISHVDVTLQTLPDRYKFGYSISAPSFIQNISYIVLRLSPDSEILQISDYAYAKQYPCLIWKFTYYDEEVCSEIFDFSDIALSEHNNKSFEVTLDTSSGYSDVVIAYPFNELSENETFVLDPTISLSTGVAWANGNFTNMENVSNNLQIGRDAILSLSFDRYNPYNSSAFFVDRSSYLFPSNSTAPSLCLSGDCFQFNAHTFLIINNTKNISFSAMQNYTFIFWTKDAVTSGHQGVFSGYNSWVPFYADINNNQCFFRGLSSVAGTTLVGDGNWHMCAYTFNMTDYASGNGTLNVYTDLGAAESNTTEQMADPPTSQFQVGAIGGPLQAFGNLKLGSMAIINRVMTQTEIEGWYNEGKSYVNTSDSGVIAGWVFNSTSYLANNISDVTGNDNNGDLGLTYNSSGKHGGSITFDGVNKIHTSHSFSQLNSTIMTSGGVSLAGWVSSRNNDTSHKSMFGLVTGTSNSDYAEGGFVIHSRNFKCVYYDTNASYYALQDTGVGVAVNTWYHMAFRYVPETSQFECYVNGVKKVNATLQAFYTSGVVQLAMGGQSLYKTPISLDEIRLFNRTISVDEIICLYNGSSCPNMQSNTSPNTYFTNGTYISHSQDSGRFGSEWNNVTLAGTFDSNTINNFITTDSGIVFASTLNNSAIEELLTGNNATNNGSLLIQNSFGNQPAHYFNGFDNYMNATITSSNSTTWWYRQNSGWNFGANASGTLYLNGESGTPANALFYNGSVLFIGMNSSSGYFTGEIWGVRVYNVTLNASDVKRLYLEGAGAYVNVSIRTSEDNSSWSGWRQAKPANVSSGLIDFKDNEVAGRYAQFLINGLGNTLFTPKISTLNLTYNRAPIINSTSINTTYGTNFTYENITVHISNSTDDDGESVKNITDWRINSTSTAFINMPFEGVSNSTFTKDYSSFGFNGTVTDAVWNATAGYDGKGAYMFSVPNTSKIVIPTKKLSENSTITFWVKQNSQLSQNMYWIGGNAVIGTQSSSTNIQTYFFNETSGWKDCKTTNVSIINNTWYHIARVLEEKGIGNKGSVRIYVNGVDRTNPAACSDDGGVHNTLNDVSVFGQYSTGSFLNGTLDDIRIYNYTLSDAEINALYANHTKILHSDKTIKGTNYSACVTPTDGSADGNTSCTGILTIVNSPPVTVNLSAPQNNSIWSLSTVNFNYTGYDADGDTIYYALHVGRLIPDTMKTNLTNTSVNVELSNGLWYWNVNATDNDGGYNSSVIWQFTIPSVEEEPSSGGGAGSLSGEFRAANRTAEQILAGDYNYTCPEGFHYDSQSGLCVIDKPVWLDKGAELRALWDKYVMEDPTRWLIGALVAGSLIYYYSERSWEKRRRKKVREDGI